MYLHMGLGRGDIHEHEAFAVATEAGLHDAGQCAFTVGTVPPALWQSLAWLERSAEHDMQSRTEA